MYIKAGTSSVGYNATYVVYEPLEDRDGTDGEQAGFCSSHIRQ